MTATATKKRTRKAKPRRVGLPGVPAAKALSSEAPISGFIEAPGRKTRDHWACELYSKPLKARTVYFEIVHQPILTRVSRKPFKGRAPWVVRYLRSWNPAGAWEWLHGRFDTSELATKAIKRKFRASYAQTKVGEKPKSAADAEIQPKVNRAESYGGRWVQWRMLNKTAEWSPKAHVATDEGGISCTRTVSGDFVQFKGVPEDREIVRCSQCAAKLAKKAAKAKEESNA